MSAGTPGEHLPIHPSILLPLQQDFLSAQLPFCLTAPELLILSKNHKIACVDSAIETARTLYYIRYELDSDGTKL